MAAVDFQKHQQQSCLGRGGYFISVVECYSGSGLATVCSLESFFVPCVEVQLPIAGLPQTKFYMAATVVEGTVVVNASAWLLALDTERMSVVVGIVSIACIELV